MFEIGRLAVKIAGRDSNRKCIVVDVIDENYVIIDGETRRKKCNVRHLEPLKEVLKIKKGASHEEVKKAFKAMGIEIADSKPRKAAERPKKQKAKKAVEPAPKEKPVKKVAKKAAKKTEEKEPEKKEEKKE